jgi:hypothetical protein
MPVLTCVTAASVLLPHSVAAQTQATEEELAELIMEACDGDPSSDTIDYNAFITKIMSL